MGAGVMVLVGLAALVALLAVVPPATRKPTVRQ